MPTYKIAFDEVARHPEMRSMLTALEEGFQAFGLDYYLVGAVARDVWLRGIHNKVPMGSTADIDFAVFVNEQGIYEQLKEYLLRNGDFYPSRQNAFALVWKGKVNVDLMPFGAIQDADGNVTVQGTGFISLHVPGFTEVYEAGLPEVELEDSRRFKLCTLPGIVLLKFIAWNDRPEKRTKDLRDIAEILHYFFDMYSNEIYDHHSDLFAGKELELSEIAARVMGREMRKIAARNERLMEQITSILEAATADGTGSALARNLAALLKNDAEENLTVLQQLKQGLND